MGNLKAAIALLPEPELSNRISAAALLVHGATGGRLRWPRLPVHLTLEQPFGIEAVPSIERYVEQLARETAPVAVELGPVEIEPPSSNGPEAVVWVRVRDCPALLDLRQRLRCDLGGTVAGASTPPKTDDHRFHLTLGFLPAAGLASPDRLPSFAGSMTMMHEIGLFLYDGLPRAGWQCMLYSRYRLGAGTHAPGSP
jgi:2'-5' RNA ligase